MSLSISAIKGLGQCLTLWVTVCLSADSVCFLDIIWDLVIAPSIYLLRFAFENLQEHQNCICYLNTKIDGCNSSDVIRQC